MSLHSRRPAQYSDRVFGSAAWYADFDNDPLLTVAYAISEWVIAYIGPLFWVYLAAALVTAVLGN
jgi:hypothetical protein